MNNISELYAEIDRIGHHTPEYWDKMMHPIPEASVVDRERFILERVKDKTVLDIGCSGPLAVAIAKRAKEYYGIDKIIEKALQDQEMPHYFMMDIDRADSMPEIPGLELVIAAEIIEHLSNAGHFLDLLHPLGAPVILTTPNAHTRVGSQYLKQGIESVNKEHVAWYSWHTMKTLLTRHRFIIKQWHWYRGDPYYAEGLIFVIEADHGKD